MCPQHVQHNVTGDRDVAFSGQQVMYAVTFTFKIAVQWSALVVWWLIQTLSVVSY